MSELKSGFMRISKSELLSSALNAVIAAIIVGFYGLVTAKGGFDLFSADWGVILQMMINWAFAGFVGSFGKKMLTTKEEKFLGVMKI